MKDLEKIKLELLKVEAWVSTNFQGVPEIKGSVWRSLHSRLWYGIAEGWTAGRIINWLEEDVKELKEFWRIK